MGRISIVLLLLLGSASAQDPYFGFGEAFSLGSDEDRLVVGYRAHTTTTLMDFIRRGALFDRLEVSPSEIRLRVGETLDLAQLRVTAYNSRGRIVAGVPLALNIEGPEDLLDFEAFRTSDGPLTAVKPGAARIWIESVPPARSREVARVPVDIVIE